MIERKAEHTMDSVLHIYNWAQGAT